MSVPPLVSVGPLVHHESMTYSPSASVLYAPVVTVPDAMVKDQDFWLYFIKGNISRCNGCGKRDLRHKDGRPRAPPYDICIQRKEYVIFKKSHIRTRTSKVPRLEKCVLPCPNELYY